MSYASALSYSPPPLPGQFNSVHPRELLPLRDPPAVLLLYPPVLPAEALKRGKEPCPISDSFSLSTHLVPAAYPRMTPFVPLPNGFAPSYTASKQERKAGVKQITEQILSLKARQSKGEVPPDEHESRLLWNSVNRYTRKYRTPEGQKSITLFLTHANGFPKEIWEPFLRHLLSNFLGAEDSTVSIDEIWAFEAVQHGDSAIINQDKLGSVYDWSDNTRDILNFLTRYLPSERTAKDLPAHLPRLEDETVSRRLIGGFAERTLVAIGHSFGGCTAALAALTAPRLFARLVLVDPVIVPPYLDRTKAIYNFVIGAIQRRSEWLSREEARRLLIASPFFATWDPAVLDVYISCGLTPIDHNAIDSETESVKLKMSGIQEGIVFSESLTTQEAFERLRDLDVRIPLRWVMAGKGSAVIGSAEATRDLVWRRPANASNTRIPSSGHLIPQEAPRELALEVFSFLKSTFVDASGAHTDERARL